LLLAEIWLIIAFFIQFISIDGVGLINLIAGSACVVLLFFQMKRAERKLAEKLDSNETK